MGGEYGMAMSANRITKQGIVRGWIIQDDVEADDPGLMEDIQQAGVIFSPQRPPAKLIQGPVVNGGDDNPSVRFDRPSQAKEQIIGIIAHPVEKAQIIGQQDKRQSGKYDQETFWGTAPDEVHGTILLLTVDADNL